MVGNKISEPSTESLQKMIRFYDEDSSFRNISIRNTSDMKGFPLILRACLDRLDIGKKTATMLKGKTHRTLPKYYPPGNDHISHLGKRKVIDSKVPWEKDMLL